MRFVVDAQLPPALAAWLATDGHEAAHVFDLGLSRAGDAAIWQHASEAGAVIITKDEDFAVRAQLGSPGPAVVWVRVGNMRRTELLRRIAAAWPRVVEALHRGESLIELV